MEHKPFRLDGGAMAIDTGRDVDLEPGVAGRARHWQAVGDEVPILGHKVDDARCRAFCAARRQAGVSGRWNRIRAGARRRDALVARRSCHAKVLAFFLPYCTRPAGRGRGGGGVDRARDGQARAVRELLPMQPRRCPGDLCRYNRSRARGRISPPNADRGGGRSLRRLVPRVSTKAVIPTPGYRASCNSLIQNVSTGPNGAIARRLRAC
jgi:hypothetical protein